ncbi:MAG: alpha/beta hydrolase, partial [Gemmatimonadota bacterium]
MRRRDFVFRAGQALAVGAFAGYVPLASSNAAASPRRANGEGGVADGPLDPAGYRAARRYAALSSGRVAYMDRGKGDAVLLLHGLPLNNLQWRGAIDRLSTTHRCVAPDFLGLGFTQAAEGQSLTPPAQVAMLVELLNTLSIPTVDLIASDSGGAIAQLFAVHHRDRVRTMLLTNCDAEPDSPPPALKPILDMAHEGTLPDKVLAPWVADKALCRSQFGTAVYVNPAILTDDVIDYYFTPSLSSPRRKSEFIAYHLGLEVNPLAGIERELKQCSVPTRIIWGMSDTIFSTASADYLDHTLPNSRGVRRIQEA